MTAAGTSAGTPADMAPREGRRALIAAWISVALLPVSFVAAMVQGDALLSLQGYDSGSAELIPPAGVALAGIPAVLVLIGPTIPAMVFGCRARRLGMRAGILPSVIGATALVYALLTNTLPLLVASLFEWHPREKLGHLRSGRRSRIGVTFPSRSLTMVRSRRERALHTWTFTPTASSARAPDACEPEPWQPTPWRMRKSGSSATSAAPRSTGQTSATRTPCDSRPVFGARRSELTAPRECRSA